MPRKGPAPRRDLSRSHYRSYWSPRSSTRSCPGQAELGRAHRVRRARHHQGQVGHGAHRHLETGHGKHQAPARGQVPACRRGDRTRFPWRCDPPGPPRCPSGGWWATSRQRREKTMPSVWQRAARTPPTVSVPRSSAGKTCTRWPNPTRRSLTTAGSRGGLPAKFESE